MVPGAFLQAAFEPEKRGTAPAMCAARRWTHSALGQCLAGVTGRVDFSGARCPRSLQAVARSVCAEKVLLGNHQGRTM